MGVEGGASYRGLLSTAGVACGLEPSACTASEADSSWLICWAAVWLLRLAIPLLRVCRRRTPRLVLPSREGELCEVLAWRDDDLRRVQVLVERPWPVQGAGTQRLSLFVCLLDHRAISSVTLFEMQAVLAIVEPVAGG